MLGLPIRLSLDVISVAFLIFDQPDILVFSSNFSLLTVPIVHATSLPVHVLFTVVIIEDYCIYKTRDSGLHSSECPQLVMIFNSVLLFIFPSLFQLAAMNKNFRLSSNKLLCMLSKNI